MFSINHGYSSVHQRARLSSNLMAGSRQADRPFVCLGLVRSIDLLQRKGQTKPKLGTALLSRGGNVMLLNDAEEVVRMNKISLCCVINCEHHHCTIVRR